MSANSITVNAQGLILENDASKRRDQERYLEQAKSAITSFTLEELNLSDREKSILNSLEISKKEGIIVVCHFRIRKGALLTSSESNWLDDYYRLLPYGLVLKAGEDFGIESEDPSKPLEVKYEVGDMIRLRESEVTANNNIVFWSLYKNQYQNSNFEEMEGKGVPKWSHDFFSRFEPFKIDPLTTHSIRDYFTSQVFSSQISGKIKDVSVFA